MKARIITERVPNPHCRDYHATSELTKGSAHERFYRPLRKSSEEYLAKLGEVGLQLVRELLAIDGIKEVCVSLYEVQILKGAAFDWGDMNDAILAALKKTFAQYNVAPEQVEVTELYDAQKWGGAVDPEFRDMSEGLNDHEDEDKPSLVAKSNKQ